MVRSAKSKVVFLKRRKARVGGRGGHPVQELAKKTPSKYTVTGKEAGERHKRSSTNDTASCDKRKPRDITKLGLSPKLTKLSREKTHVEGPKGGGGEGAKGGGGGIAVDKNKKRAKVLMKTRATNSSKEDQTVGLRLGLTERRWNSIGVG